MEGGGTADRMNGTGWSRPWTALWRWPPLWRLFSAQFSSAELYRGCCADDFG